MITLEKKLQVAIREKEEQCQTFRELLLEKEKEIEELAGMVEDKEAGEEGGGSGKGPSGRCRVSVASYCWSPFVTTPPALLCPNIQLFCLAQVLNSHYA